MIKRALVVSVALAGCLALAAGCGSSDQKNETSGDMQTPAQTSAATSAAPADATIVYGVEDADGAAIAVANKTGQDITAIVVKATGDGEYLPSLIPEGEAMLNGSTAMAYLPKIEAAVSEDSDIQTKAVADIRITTSDGTEYELHQIDVYDVADAALRLSDGVAYLEYTSVATGEAISTLEAELAWLEAMAAEQAASDEQAAAQEAAEEYYEEEYYYEEPTYYEEPAYYEEPTYYEEPAASGAEDQCVPDIILR